MFWFIAINWLEWIHGHIAWALKYTKWLEWEWDERLELIFGEMK